MDIIFQLSLIVLCILAFGYFAMYSRRILDNLNTSRSVIARIYFKLFGRTLKQLNVKVTRTANLNKKSKFYKIYAYFDDIITNLDMKKDDVTVSGVLIFMCSISLSLGVIFSVLVSSWGLIIPLTAAFFYLINTLFRFASLLKYEQREAEIMDAVDLLVSDVQGGIYNAVLRYQDSFHPNIKHHFMNFIDDIQNKGYSFKQAMIILNNNLGNNFTDFAQKAILYEEKADNTMSDIFSSIIELNRQRRTLRYINNIKFAELRMQFLVSLGMIGGYAIFTTLVDPYIMNFLLNTFIGKIMLIADIVIVTWVLSYIAAIKAKSL